MGQFAEYSKVYERNPTTLLEFGDFSGGEVLARPAETLQPNELSYAENWDVEEDGLKLVVREGLTEYADIGAAVTAVYEFLDQDETLYVKGGKLYSWDPLTSTGTEIGSLTGTGAPCFCEWGDKGSAKLLIASGGILQAYDGTTLSSVSGTLSADVVFVANSRVVIATAGSHDTVWSDIGDHTGWTHDSDDASSSQTLPVGYKDGGDIVAIAALSKDVIVFKDSGVIYRITGSSPNWTVSEVARNSDVPSRQSVLAMGGDLWYLDRRDGIRTLATTAAYGDIGVAKEGKSISTILAPLLTADARMWHVKSKSQIWVRPNSGTTVYVYHYPVGCWTHYDFAATIADVSSRESDAYVAQGNKILTVGGSTDDGTAYIATVRPRVSREAKPHILVRFQVAYDSLIEGLGVASVGPVSLNLPSTNWTEDVAYLDTDEAYTDTDPLVSEYQGNVLTRQVWRSTEFIPEVVVTSGRIRLRKIYLWVKGVSA